MLGRLLESLYNKAFINIVVDGGKTEIYMELCSANKNPTQLNNATASFQTDRLTPKVLEFIESYTKETPYYYVSFLDNSLSQGAIPTCEKDLLLEFCNPKESKQICIGDSWSCFTSKADINALKSRYDEIGVDFVFSPFNILANFFKDKISTGFAMFILIQTSSMSVAVFKQKKLLFGEYLDMHHMIEEDRLSSGDLDEGLELDDGIDLEDIDVDDDELELIDDFSDIEDLDSIEDIDEFAQHRDIEEELLGAIDDSDESDEEGRFNEDYQRFTLIQSSIATYYKDIKYESDFIENLYIADSVGVSSDLKRYLEEEMFLNVYIRKSDIAIELCQLAKMELK